jgi:hypothetical protein
MSKNIGKTAAAGIMVCIALFGRCSQAPVTLDGGSGTGVGNGVITGQVLHQDGSTVQNGIVRMRSTGYLADTSGTVSTLRNDSIATVITDAQGRFEIDSVDTSKEYCIEVMDTIRHELGTLYKVDIPRIDTVRLATRTVTPLKILQGTITVGGLPKNAYVLLFGLERVDRADSTGKFVITDLPLGNCEFGECEYRCRVIFTDTTGMVQVVDTELEIEFDPLGNIREVELELYDD